MGVISQCFDTLTELIQGPCTENQMELVESKFTDILNTVLNANTQHEESCDIKTPSDINIDPRLKISLSN